MHKVLVVITVLAFVSGILDLVLNVAILTKVSNENAFKAVREVYAPKAKPTPTAAVASVSATPALITASPSGKFNIKSATPTPVKKILTPVPSAARVK